MSTSETIDTGTDELLCELCDRVATVTLNRPHKRNSLSDQLSPALRAILLDLELRHDVGCVLLTGAGDAFCSGGDVSGMSGNPAKDEAPRQRQRARARRTRCALGLVNAIFPEKTFRADAFEHTRKLANGPTMALSRMKRNVNRGADVGLRDALEFEAQAMIASFQSDDAKEAIRAFAEKRTPEFKFR